MDLKNYPIVITGATGFLGQYLIKELASQNCEIYALVRDITKAETLFRGLNIKWIEGSITEEDTFKSLPKQARIFHCAAIIGSLQSKKNVYEAVNVIGTKNLLDIAIQQEATSFTFVSSISAVGAMGSLNNPITEKTLASPKTFYGQSKLVAENLILEQAPHSMPITIVRPSIIYGPGQRNSSGAGALFQLCRKKVIPTMGHPESLIPLVYVKNVVEGMITLTLNNKGHEIFNLSDPTPYSLKTLSELLDNKNPKHFLKIPRLASNTVSTVSDLVSHLFKKDFGLRTEILKVLSQNGFMMSIDKAAKFGFSPNSTNEIIKTLLSSS